jgi:hypothetical protein
MASRLPPLHRDGNCSAEAGPVTRISPSRERAASTRPRH